MTRENRFVFGPVPSRRLGRSLGVDLVPFKTCSFDCVYCQLGRTTHHTTTRKVYAPTEELIAELTATFEDDPDVDYVTLAGSGEPTLHSQLGEIVSAVKEITETPIVILTNGSLFWNPEVRADCAQADVILPTLAAHDEETYRRIHRPAPGIDFRRHLSGLLALRDETKAALWLELFLLKDLNASMDDCVAFKALIDRIQPERVQINTAVRPAAEPDAHAVPLERLEQWARLLGPTVEVIANVAPAARAYSETTEAEVLALCRRRPCTLEQVAAGLGIHRNEAVKFITQLQAANRLHPQWHGDQQFFTTH